MAQITSTESLDMDQVTAPLHEQLIGTSEAIQSIKATLEKLAAADITVLVTGESGTGKDIAARIIHRLSHRFGKPFIKVNCPAIPESILESELFGYERGAFTGARTSKPGRLELANNGTIFLDEIAETSYNVQSKLLQVLDGEPFLRIGGTTQVHTDVRIIGATNVALEDAVRQGRMREDMYFRLSEMIVAMPPLRERIEDLPLLAEHFNYNFAAKLGKEYEPIPGDVLVQMAGQLWEGNIRELAGRVKKYVATRVTDVLLQGEREVPRTTIMRPAPRTPESAGAARAQASAPQPVNNPGTTPPAAAAPAPAAPRTAGPEEERKFVPLKVAAREAMEAAERGLIEDVLRYTLWNRRKAARLLDVSYSSLLRRIDAYNIGRTDGE